MSKSIVDTVITMAMALSYDDRHRIATAMLSSLSSTKTTKPALKPAPKPATKPKWKITLAAPAAEAPDAAPSVAAASIDVTETDSVITIAFLPPSDELPLPDDACEKMRSKVSILRHGLQINKPLKTSSFITDEEWEAGTSEVSYSETELVFNVSAKIATAIRNAERLDKVINHSAKGGIVFRYSVVMSDAVA